MDVSSPKPWFKATRHEKQSLLGGAEAEGFRWVLAAEEPTARGGASHPDYARSGHFSWVFGA